MPALASPSTWRTSPHRYNGYLYVLAPDVIFAALVNQASFAYPLASLTYDTVSVGAYTDIVVGQTVRISAAGVVKGYGRVRLTPTSSILYIGAVGEGDISLANNDTIEVLDDFRLWAKIPRLDVADPRNAAQYKDYDLAYSDQGTKPNPKCNAGPHYINFVNAGTNLITVVFNLTSSFAVAPSATISSYAGDIQDGTITVGSIASGSFTATFPAGKRWCHFTVTDSNSKTHTAHVLVAACERSGANAPILVRVSSHHGALEGWDASFSVLADDVSVDVIPENTMILYFEEETYGSSAGSLNGQPNRLHIKFVGWTIGASIEINPDVSDVEISAVGPLGILAAMPAFSQSAENQATPTAWHQIKTLTVFRFLWYLLHWHTTALDLCDLSLPSWYASYPYSRLQADAGTPYEVVDQVASFVTARFTCDRSGTLLFKPNPLWMSASDRNSLTTTVTLASSDWDAVRIEERQRPQDYWLRGSGFLASASSPAAYLAIAPGTSPGQGAQEDSFDKQIVTSQSDLNIRVGHVYAERNSSHPRMTIEILKGGMVADPAWREWIKFTLAAASNRREISFSEDRFVLLEVTVTHDHDQGVYLEEWALQEETSGAPAATYYLPTDRGENINYSPLPPFEFSLPDLIEYDPRPASLPDLLFLDSVAMYGQDFASHKILRCRNFGSGSEVWEKVFAATDLPSVYGASQFVGAFALDGWNPKQAMYIVSQGASGSAEVIELWYVENLDAPAGQQTFTRLFVVILDTNGLAQYVGVSINVNGMVGFGITEFGSSFNFYHRTSKSGAFSDRDWGSSGGSLFYFDYGKKAANGASGVLYVCKRDGDFNVRAYRSNDNGATLNAAEQTLGGQGASMCHVPYENNDNDNVAYFGMEGSVGTGRLYRRNEDTSYTNITFDIGNGNESPLCLHSFTGDRNYLVAVSQYFSGIKYISRSTNGGTTWTPCAAPNADTFVYPYLAGWPYNKEVMVCQQTSGGIGGVNRGIYWTNEMFSEVAGSIAWVSAFGNWEIITGAAFVGAHLVPVWTN